VRKNTLKSFNEERARKTCGAEVHDAWVSSKNWWACQHGTTEFGPWNLSPLKPRHEPSVTKSQNSLMFCSCCNLAKQASA
jgi:hypothetical protein